MTGSTLGTIVSNPNLKDLKTMKITPKTVTNAAAAAATSFCFAPSARAFASPILETRSGSFMPRCDQRNLSAA